MILRRKIAVGDGGGHLGDVADLRRQVAGHEVDGVGQVLPGAADALDLGLAAQLAFGAHLARHARHFAGERVELVHHGVDGVLQLQNFAAHVHRDLARQVALGHRGGHLGDVADLRGQVAGHGVHRVGQDPSTCPPRRARRAWPPSLPSVPTSRATRVTSDGERAELVHHGVDGVLQAPESRRARPP